MMLRRIAALALALVFLLGAAPPDAPEGVFVFSDHPGEAYFGARYGLMSLSGEILLEARHDAIYTLTYAIGDANAPQIFFAEDYTDEGFSQALYGVDGKRLTHEKYTFVTWLRRGYIAARYPEGDDGTHRMDILKANGEMLLEGPFHMVTEGPRGFVGWSGTYEGGVDVIFYGMDWKETARRHVASAYPYDAPREGAWLIPYKLFGKWGYMDDLGETVVEPVYDHAEVFQANGYGLVSEGDKYALMNRSGTIVAEFDEARHYGQNRNFAILSATGIATLLRADDLSEIASAPKYYNYGTYYPSEGPHSEWVAGERSAGGYDMIHLSGRKIALPDALSVSTGLRHAIVARGADIGSADHALLNLETDKEVPLGRGDGRFSYDGDRILMWQEEGNCRLYDLDGNLLASHPWMSEIYDSGGLYHIEYIRYGQSRLGVIDRDGNMLLEPEYSHLDYLPRTGGVLEVQWGDEEGYMTLDGTWIHKQSVYNRLED